MIVNGRAIAEDILNDLKRKIDASGTSPHLTVFTYDPDFATNKYLTLKHKKAESVGITMQVVEFGRGTSTDEVCERVKSVLQTTNGVILQLPFPSHIDVDAVLSTIPNTHDVDALNPEEFPLVHSPVVGACEEILDRHKVRVAGKKVLVIGKGRLVGIPAAAWFRLVGGEVEVIDKNVRDISSQSLHADIILLGVGRSRLLTPEMIQEGAVIIDAGTSEEGGELRGDADPRCADKASLFTPVPGGVGPITIAMLLRNLVTLTKRQ